MAKLITTMSGLHEAEKLGRPGPRKLWWTAGMRIMRKWALGDGCIVKPALLLLTTALLLTTKSSKEPPLGQKYWPVTWFGCYSTWGSERCSLRIYCDKGATHLQTSNAQQIVEIGGRSSGSMRMFKYSIVEPRGQLNTCRLPHILSAAT